MKTSKAKSSRKRKNGSSPFLWIGAFLVVIIILSFVPSIDFNPVGKKITVMPDRSHVPIGTDPGPYNSDPPASGRHYAEHFTSNFFDTNSYTYPEGYLVHNLEHGYVIFWYNCDLLSELQCLTLKSEIQDVMDQVNMYKVIAYPWPSVEVPVVLTSWGRMLSMPQFDSQLALAFIDKYQEQSPEPQGE